MQVKPKLTNFLFTHTQRKSRVITPIIYTRSLTHSQTTLPQSHVFVGLITLPAELWKCMTWKCIQNPQSSRWYYQSNSSMISADWVPRRASIRASNTCKSCCNQKPHVNVHKYKQEGLAGLEGLLACLSKKEGN